MRLVAHRLLIDDAADEGLGGAQVRRLGLEPGLGGWLHAHLQQGEGGEADPGREAGGARQRRRAWQRQQALRRRRLRLIIGEYHNHLHITQHNYYLSANCFACSFCRLTELCVWLDCRSSHASDGASRDGMMDGDG